MNTLEEIVFVIGVGGLICFGFGIMSIVSDFILPHCKRLNDWINTLPMMQKETHGKKNSY